MCGHDKAKKTATYGVMHLCVATAVSYAFTGDILIAMGIGLVEPLVQTGFYYVHEEIWEKRLKRVAVRNHF